MPDNEEDARLARAEKAPVEDGKISFVSTKEARNFGELREKHQHFQFWIIFIFAIAMSAILYTAFLLWAGKPQAAQHWHIGLMLVLPATTILLALVQVLRHKGNKKEEDAVMFAQAKEIVDFINAAKDIIK